jgi:hypothetical protein
VKDSRGESIEMAPLETFDPSAFVSAGDAPQDVRSFVLALAAIYNDFKTIMLADNLLETQRPPDPPANTPDWGEYNGFRIYLVRVLAGLFNELLRMISRNEAVLSEPDFRQIVKRIPRPSRESWDAIVAAALAQPSKNPLTKALLLARNKVSFHYRLRFGQPGPAGEPYVSRGATMLSTRFFFADAAAQAYLNQCLETEDTRKQFGPASPLMHQVNIALHEIVISFVESMGCAWRRVSSSI